MCIRDSPTYVKYYNVIYNYLLPYFKDIKANELNTKQVELFTASLLKEGKNGKPLSPKTVKDILSLFKSIIGYIESEHNISINTKIIYPKKQKEKERILSKEEFINLNQTLLQEIDSVSYTHLDVYKRQVLNPTKIHMNKNTNAYLICFLDIFMLIINLSLVE